MAYIYLTIAIIAEVIGTASLKASEGFTRLMPSIATVLGFGIAFFSLSLVLKTIPVGIAYAIWAGAGIVLVTAIGYVWFRQALDWPAVAGIALIVAGVVVINVFSESVAH